MLKENLLNENKLINKYLEENKINNESEINLSEETKEVCVQVGENKNKNNLGGVDKLINLNITESYQESPNPGRENWFKAFKNNNLLNKNIK